MSRAALWVLGALAVVVGSSYVTDAPAAPVQDIDDLLDRATDGSSVRRRLAAIERLAQANNQGAAVALARVVRHASDGRLRAAAARGLGTIETVRAAPLLVELIANGNTRETRAELGEAIARKSDGVHRLVRRLATRAHDDALGRRLLVTALGEDPGIEGRRVLERLARGYDDDLRVAAVRALARLRSGRALSRELAGIVLAEFDDPDTCIYALDLLTDAPLEVLEDNETVLASLAVGSTLAVRRRARFGLDRMRFRREMAERDEVRETRYARTGTDPTEPRMTARAVDVIFAVDTTFSEYVRLGRRQQEIADRVHQLQLRGVDLRVGIIAYRDHLRDANQRRIGYTTRELPLTFDIPRAIAWLNSLGAAGVDTQGLAISNTLHEGFARMNWRWDANREFHLIAGAMIDRPTDAARTAAVHTRSDRTALFFYGGRSPHNLAFARAAGIDVGTWR